MKKALMIVAMIAIIAIAGSLIYYFIFFKPEQEKAAIKLQEQKLDLEKGKQRAEEIKIEKEKEYKAQQELNKEQQELNKKAYLAKELESLTSWYNEAMKKAYDNYKENWYNACIGLGLPPDSGLPKDIANHLNDRYDKQVELVQQQYQNQKDELYRLYN